MKKLLLFVAFIMIVSLALVGCSANEDAAGDGSEGSGGSKSAKDTLVFGRGSDSVSLDPATVTGGPSFAVTKNIYETLVNFSYKEQSTEIVDTGLAKEWKTSDDGKTYTFTLKEGIKFHDGTDFNAEAVAFNFKRWKDGEGEFPYYPSMFGGYGKDSVLN